jgi:fatty acid desaturase
VEIEPGPEVRAESDIPSSQKTAALREDHDAAKAIARTFASALDADPRTAARERLAGLQLLAEWMFVLGTTYGLVYGVPWLWLKALLLVPWSLYAALALDNITHYANHWPLLQSRLGNALWRCSGVTVFFNTLEIKAIHTEHHRAYNQPDSDERPFTEADRGRSFWGYLASGAWDGLMLLWPLRPMDPVVAALAKRRPAEYREIVLTRWAFPLWFGFLLVCDWQDTLLLVPSVLMVGSLGSLVMNLTDHIPGDAKHPFRLATYLQPSTLRERLYSAVNHHTAATHLTHHLFARFHWLHLRRLQDQLAPIYERNGAPRSLLLTSVLVGNPLRFAALLGRLEKQRFDVHAP